MSESQSVAPPFLLPPYKSGGLIVPSWLFWVFDQVCCSAVSGLHTLIHTYVLAHISYGLVSSFDQFRSSHS
jgi:hypothetical protein